VVERLVAARGGSIRIPAFAMGLAMVVAVMGGGGLLTVAGFLARPAAALGAPVGGEQSTGPAAVIPTVEIDPEAHRIAASITPAVAQAIGQYVAAELAARDRAAYVLDRMTVVLLRNLLRPQDAPKIGMAVHGTKNGAPYQATLALRPLPGGHYALG
jgi:hypothetical protein